MIFNGLLELSDQKIDIPKIKLYLSNVFNENNKINISKFTVEENITTPVDQHEVNELWIIHEGHGLITSQQNKINVTTGNIFFIPSNMPHAIQNIGHEILVIFSIWWEK